MTDLANLTICLPDAAVSKPMCSPTIMSTAKQRAECRSRVIVADDDDFIRQILIEVVEETLPAVEVIEATDGMQALEAYQKGGADFLISDHFMPRMDGMTLVGKIREHEPNLPILMVSVEAEAEANALAAGASRLLCKEEIFARIPELLRAYTHKRETA